MGLFRECLELHRLWSFSLPGSDVARLNRADGGSWVEVDRRTARLIRVMADFHDVEPAFDFTIGPVSYLWKGATCVPTDAEVAEALTHVGADKVEVEGNAVRKSDPLVHIDVGGAAKGFAADAMAARLRGAGVASADIDLGGNLFMLGSHPSGRPWRVSVRVPEGVRAEPPVLEAVDRSVVTSGSYERFAEIDGVRYQHVVDARTGCPSESDLVSATVVASTSLEADLLATTALLAGSAGLPALESRHPDCTFVALSS